MQPLQALTFFALLGLASCSATSNPRLEDASAVPSFAAEATSAEPGQSAAEDRISVARVAGRDVDVRALLVRSWWRSSNTLREMLEQLVVERLAGIEAKRLGIWVDPEGLQQAVEESWIAMRARIAESGSDLEAEEFVRRVLGLDPDFYAEQLANDALVQILLERVVRAWSLGSERSVLSILAVEDESVAQRVVAELEAGREFSELALAFGVGETKELGLERVSVVHDERVELARVARLTEPGEFGGPIEESGRFLVFEVIEHLPALAAGPSGSQASAPRADIEAIERSLGEEPVEEIEYLQWRAAMERRYEIDLSPFAELVEGSPKAQP